MSATMPLCLGTVCSWLEMVILVRLFLLDLPVADFHSLAVETAGFCKTANDKIHFAL